MTPDLRGLWLAGGYLRGFNLARARLDGATLERADLAGVHAEGASLKDAHVRYANLSNVRAEKSNLSGADFRGATLVQGDFRRCTCLPTSVLGTSFIHANLRQANFTGARMREARFSDADLTETIFNHADLKEALLNDAILDGTSLIGAKLSGAHVYGTFIRRVKIDETTDQDGLFVDVHVVWEREPPRRRKQRQPGLDPIVFTEADDIRIAQFHNIVDEAGSVGKLLAAATQRVVLILGRFLPRQKRVLEALADALSRRGKSAVIFDFPSPDNREISDTVRFIAGMSQFIVVDMTKASSVPLELQATIPELMVPVLPIVQSGHPIFAMFSDLQKKYFWIQQPVSYDSAQQLVDCIDEAIILPAQRAAEQIRERRAVSVRPPVNVARVGRNSGKKKR